ncbi:uncharacterized protein LOC122397036 isoform X2 [Colletes gigas]|uniref:uncharacterized protein LOC122397036 isoform X2 n=1 Tax=Colletes gigas TaxID=935657 RepID=UPI001C9A9B3B|nr:uncharacterized protein LOC122397036 isoform X2 [Colletes gigas]
MLFFGVLSILLAVASAEFCYSDVEGACSTKPTSNDGALVQNCNAKYGAIDALQADLQSYAQREGFKKLYRKHSDKTWEDAIDLMKYIAKRGGRMNFNQLPRFTKSAKESRVLELNEINSLARALDTEKQLAEEAMRIHAQAHPHNKHDASVAHYIEEQFFESQTGHVRDLAGYTNDLKNLLTERDPSVSVFLFDEILKKSL